MKAVSFASVASPTPEEIRALDRLADELRMNVRARRVADGLPIAQAFDLFFAEQAGLVGLR